MNTEGSITRLGSKLHYWITGPEGGTLIVMAHGATMDHHTFDSQVPVLTEADYQVLTWDLRGHGKSKPLGEGIMEKTFCGNSRKKPKDSLIS